MPELPEVESIRRNLEELILDKDLLKLEQYTPEVLVNPDNLDPCGEKLSAICRRGKYLILKFLSCEMMIHLRMTGKLLFETADSDPAEDEKQAKHMRARLCFSDGSRLIFDDIRRFGRISIFPPGECSRDKGFSELGPDAISPEWTEEDFLAKLKRRPQSSIKAALLDQCLVAGFGNIYVDEALFRAGIRPQTRVCRISQKQLRNLQIIGKEILLEAIGLGGTSFRDYVNSFGKKGKFQLQLAVYQREGQACRQCGTEIKKIQVAGRGTRYCPNCQK